MISHASLPRAARDGTGLSLRIAVPDKTALPKRWTVWNEAIGAGGPDFTPARSRPDDLALIAYTGGTTGHPKGVYHSQHRLAVNLLASIISGDIGAGEVMLLATPLSHSAGYHLQGCLVQGGTVVLVPRFDPANFLALAREREVTWTFAVPTMLYRLFDALGAGAPIPEEAERVRAIMRRYLEIRNVPSLIEALKAEGIVTKVQQRTSGPHRGGIPFARGSLFHLLKNPVYRGKIVHKGKVFDGEHEAIVDEELWERVQLHLAAKAPPRKRSTNERQQALLRGLIRDPHGRPMVPTYGSSKIKRYAYYETRKDLARPGDSPGLRFQRGQIEQHLIGHLEHLLNDEHGLRRLSGIEEAGQLRTLFATAHLLAMQLREIGKAEPAIRSLVAAISIRPDCIEVTINPAGLTTGSDMPWAWSMPLPVRRPFREARIRIDAKADGQRSPGDLLALIADAMAAQRLVLASPKLSLHQIAKREGRCRTQLARLLRLSWLSPRIIEAIADGTQPKGLTRRALLICDMPIDWVEQERQFGFAA